MQRNTINNRIPEKWLNLFSQLKKRKNKNKEIKLTIDYLGWKGFHPDLLPNNRSISSKEFLCLAKSSKNGVFIEGFLKPENSNDFVIHLTRSGNEFALKIYGKLVNKYTYNAIAFLQRGGHGIKQGEAFDILTNQGYKGAIFSPQLDNFSTKADKFQAKYLDEVGFTTHLRVNKKRHVQTNLPTEPSDERFLLSLVAMIECNWIFFLACCRAKLAVIDSKAEAGALASAIQKSINPDLKIALIAYTLYDNLSLIPKSMILSDKEYLKRLGIAGMKEYGVPNGLTFMKEKIYSVKKNKNAVILYMSFQNKKEIYKKAIQENVKNILVIPQISPKISFGSKSAHKMHSKVKMHVMRLNSSTYLQAREILSIFFRVAKAMPFDKFYLIAKEEQISIILPKNPPKNFKYLGWIETNRSLTKYIPQATTLWIHGGNRPSVIESLHACKVGVVPVFFTQDQFTIEAAKFWKKRKLDLIKMLALMMAIEPNVERWEMLTTIIAENKILEKLMINPLKPDVSKLITTIKNVDSIKPQVQKALSKLPIATTDLFASIYKKLLERKSVTAIRRECSL